MNATQWAHANELYGIDRRQARRIRRRDSRRPMAGTYTPHACGKCGCREFAWNLENHVLKTDKPYTCTCGHPAMQHTYMVRR